MEVEHLDKYGCLPWNIHKKIEKFKTVLFIKAVEFSFPYKRPKESFESIYVNFIIN
jgi:hypothetical protein